MEMDLLSKRFLHTHMRIANRRLVLEKIIGSDEISRVALAKSTGLTKATVSAIVADLIDDGLVVELGSGITARGRKPIMLKFAERSGIAAGVSIDADEIEIVVTDLYGTVLLEENIEITGCTPEKAVRIISSNLDRLAGRCGRSRYSLTGIGCAIPGIVDNRGIVVNAPYIRWQNVNFSEMLNKKTGVPVFCENVANMLTVAEIMHFPNEKAAICLRIRSGIRAGIIINGEIYTGGDGFAGEVGHMQVEPDGLPCACGQTGCWETRASERALRKSLVDSGFAPGTRTDYHVEANELSGNIFHEYARWLATGIVSLINMFNPVNIMLNSPMISSNDSILSLLNQELERRLTPLSFSSCRIELSTARRNAASIGAAVSAADRFISRMA